MLESLIVVTAISIAFSVPVLISSYYTVILFFSSLFYPRSPTEIGSAPKEWPTVSILVAVYNEKFVIEKTLDALLDLDYPKEKLQVIVADDSTDETSQVIDLKISQLGNRGLNAQASRRASRAGYKSGALNHASPLLEGEYTLLLDADSKVTPTVLRRGLSAFGADSKIGFVSFRVAHYNREQNMITRLFALQLDQGDTISKMGSYSLNAPFSFQGGYTLVSTPLMREIGGWTNDSIVDDADLSCKIYSKGRRGIYLSDVRIFGEDPSTLEVWKKQATRVAQGWAKCARSNWRNILGCPSISVWRRIALLLMLLGPFSALSWIVVTFSSAIALMLGVTTPAGSIFSSTPYVVIVTVPVLVFFVSGAYALWVQKILTTGRLLLLPLISYTSSGLITAISVGFLSGIAGKPGAFFRTPKRGPDPSRDNSKYFDEIRFDRVAVAEAILAITSIGLSIAILQKEVWLLSLSLLGYGVLTLKSMGLSRLFGRRLNAA